MNNRGNFQSGSNALQVDTDPEVSGVLHERFVRGCPTRVPAPSAVFLKISRVIDSYAGAVPLGQQDVSA